MEHQDCSAEKQAIKGAIRPAGTVYRYDRRTKQRYKRPKQPTTNTYLPWKNQRRNKKTKLLKSSGEI
jgi:hypothetical protein